MDKIKFGTDGWRAVIAESFTFANLERVAQASAEYWKGHRAPGCQPLIAVGYDRRFLSGPFARRAAEVLAGNGLRVVLTSVPTPTPALSLAVPGDKAAGGIMITASHNPAAFNGFKLKAHYGGSASPEICAAVEDCLDRRPPQAIPFETARRDGRIRVRDLRPAHYRAIRKRVDFPLISRSGLCFAHEALYGVGAGCFDALLEGTRCRVTTLHGEWDPNFGGLNPEPVPQYYQEGSRYLRRHPHDLCLVTDGDADRVGGMDGRGGALTTHQIICLLLHHFIVNRQGRGRVVKALTTTSMVDKICDAYGLELVETGVGFKYICAEMLKGDVLLGFEESGGIGFPNHIPERDGLLAGLALLEMMAMEQMPLRRLLSRLDRRFGPHRYHRIDIHFPLEKRAALMDFCLRHPPARLRQSPVSEIKSYDGVKFIAKNGSWLMLRGSGTEPVLRVYAEGPSEEAARQLVRQGYQISRRCAKGS